MYICMIYYLCITSGFFLAQNEVEVVLSWSCAHSGPHLRSEHTNENWAYGRSKQNLEFINMDVSGDYDQISRQV